MMISPCWDFSPSDEASEASPYETMVVVPRLRSIMFLRKTRPLSLVYLMSAAYVPVEG